MVGGLIEEQQLRAAHQGAREVGAHAQPSGEGAQRALEVLRVDAQARGELRGTAARAVAAVRVVARVQGGLVRAIAARLGVGELPLERAQLEVAVEDVLDEGGVGVGQVLGDGGDPEGRRRGVFPGIEMQLPEDQRQERQHRGHGAGQADH